MPKTILRTAMLFCIAMLLLATGFEAIPLRWTFAEFKQAEQQEVRAEIITKDVLILAYRPASEHAQAISDLQVDLPLFEQEQVYLATIQDEQTQQYVLLARPDFLAIDQAGRAALAQKSASIEAEILLAHDRSYVYEMNDLLSYAQSHLDARTWQLFLIEAIANALILVCLLIFWFRIEVQKNGGEKTK